MKIYIAIVLVLFLIAHSQPLAQNNTTSGDRNAPLLYYYSNVLKGIVVERADGSDSRILGRGVVEEDAGFTQGPGWSPDDSWFAWHVEIAGDFYPENTKGYAVHIDGERTIAMLDDFSCVFNMYWHPTQNILLVHGVLTSGESCAQNSDYPVATYWLIDVDNEWLLTTFSINAFENYPIIYWLEDEQIVQFSALVSAWEDNEYISGFYLISMHFDGTVTMEPTSIENSDTMFDGLTPDLSARPSHRRFDFTSWWDQPEQRVKNIPPAIEYNGGAVAGLWDISSEWILIGHEFCRAGCAYVIGTVGIYHPATGLHREISDCGAAPSCVGWIPEIVDIDALAQGSSTSVLPTPVSIEYSENPIYSRFFSDVVTHEIACNHDNGQRELVRNLESGQIDFVLPASERCGAPIQREHSMVYDTKFVVFALSPNIEYFAITDKTEYTSLYDATTGEIIATFKFYGEELLFSDDNTYLSTKSTTATATWDIVQLIANYVP